MQSLILGVACNYLGEIRKGQALSKRTVYTIVNFVYQCCCTAKAGLCPRLLASRPLRVPCPCVCVCRATGRTSEETRGVVTARKMGGISRVYNQERFKNGYGRRRGAVCENSKRGRASFSFFSRNYGRVACIGFAYMTFDRTGRWFPTDGHV